MRVAPAVSCPYTTPKRPPEYTTMFDLAAVVAREGEDYTIAALRQCGPERCEAALRVAEAMAPDFAIGVISQLMYREHHRPLVREAQTLTQAALRAALT